MPPKGVRQRAPKLYTDEGRRLLLQAFHKAGLALEGAPPRKVSASVSATCTRCSAQVRVYIRNVIDGKRDWHCMCESQQAKRRCKISTDIGRARLIGLLADAGYDLDDSHVQNGSSSVSTVCRTCGVTCKSMVINLVNGHLPNCECRCWRTEKIVLDYVRQRLPEDLYCESQATIGCVSDAGYQLRFDIGVKSVADDEIVMLIEVDGDQHFQPYALERRASAFERQLENDLQKEQHCLANGFHLLRMHQPAVLLKKSFDWRKLIDQKIAIARRSGLPGGVDRHPVQSAVYTSGPYASLRFDG